MKIKFNRKVIALTVAFVSCIMAVGTASGQDSTDVVVSEYTDSNEVNTSTVIQEEPVPEKPSWPIHLDGVVAIVGNAVILKSDVEVMLEQLKSQGVDAEQSSFCHVWNELLFQKLLVHRADVDSVEVTEKEVDVEINRRLTYLLTQMGGSEVEFEKYFDKTVLEFKKEVRPVIKDNLKVQKMQASIAQEVDISPFEVQEYYDKIPKDSLPIIPEQYKIAQIIINPVPSQYETKRIRKQIDEIREEIIKGKDFGLMALLHSQDPGSKVKRGELGFVSRNQLVPAFSAAAFKLKEGEVSEVVESEFGFHIIKLIERKGTFVNVRHILLSPKVYSTDIELCKMRVDSILAELKKDGANFNKIASVVSDDARTKENGGVMINFKNGDDYFTAEDLDENLFFAIQKLEKGETSAAELIQIQGGKNAFRLIHLMEKIDFHVGTIETDYAKIKKSALAFKKKKSIDKWVSENIKGSYLKLPEECKQCDNLKLWNIQAVNQ
ncbi:MAG: peptidyl-prolyl cis-trans isomerase SurA [Saprospiraceae bacterium]|jgi:peptidyl-prolyl cis-trans isomerase SurA